MTKELYQHLPEARRIYRAMIGHVTGARLVDALACLPVSYSHRAQIAAFILLGK